ncbi:MULTISPECIES: DUF72 domain-containing protein [unclassified Pseudomonas]|uniref:DUF72 domain-containing protein n=1 Tax=unclassified Pseudomonas TaxID=196821 RepID=UPI002448C313|nr:MULTISPECIES: DUF72 domain-containing protein [unclassified Pseudomonas]MDG9925645.1 DUF72 domain-containing protein [Pseudomonas sp. GD04045]MDH0037238.1 DUF72 domain-containing protein [Pseudomonas sp. GD04019]
MSDIRIGISGWRYAPWRGDFYPKGLPQRRELEFASREVNSIEINGSFYGLQTPQRYANWYADTPDDFVFSVKAPRYITHVRRLRDIAQPLANFFASGPLQLKDKLGPILWQFPPSFAFDAQLFRDFLAQLPQDTEQAHDCALHAEARLHVPGYLGAAPGRALRHAVEIRNHSFLCPAFVELLRKYHVALVVADTAGKWPYAEDITADFLYLRLHGDVKLYTSGYSPQALLHWQTRIEAWTAGKQPVDARLIDPEHTPAKRQRDLYCYFDNDVKVRAPYDARHLLEGLGRLPQRRQGELA